MKARYKRSERDLRTERERLREFAGRLETVREEERSRIAREIHDELGQALTVLKLDLSWLERNTPPHRREARKKMKSMSRYLDDTIERVRRMVSELRPSILDDLGLIPAIEWQVAEFQKRTGIRCRLRSDAGKKDLDLNLDSEQSSAIFRVVQESLTNVMRHAKASTVHIDIEAEKDLLKISVADNGKGMREEVIDDLQSLGITGMKERISRVGGRFGIQSRPGCGTRIEIKVPINHD